MRQAQDPRNKPRGIHCPHYRSLSGGKRCRSYRDGGRCIRPEAGQGRCVEWLKVNAPPSPPVCNATPQESPGPRDLFGNPIEQPQKPLPSRAAPAGPAATSAPSSKPPLVRNVTDEEVASFKALGVEVCLRSEALGEVWLVPKYTDADRVELSVEHSAMLTAICSAFPGARVVELNRKPRQ